MKDNVMKKYLVIGVLALLLWISTSFIHSISEERRGRRAEVLKEISSSLTAEQKIGTPYITVDRLETFTEKGVSTTNRDHSETFYPASAEFSGTAAVDSRSRGIFKAQAYDLRWQGEAEFELPEEKTAFKSGDANTKVRALEPVIVVPVSAKKGLQSFPIVKIGSTGKTLKPRTCGSVICYDTGLTYAEAREAMKKISVQLQVSGIDQVTFESNAYTAQFTLQSNWANPGFAGSYLPTSRKITEQGFEAKWNIVKAQEIGEDSQFSTRFMEPMDVYTLTDRATKYSILFIICVFGGFILVEVANKAKLHPLQYGLVGAALVVFYLLVLSLSEHIPFIAAYAISSVASTALITVYLSAVMKSRKSAGIFSAALLFLYATLYVILSAEDFALLFGSSLIFGLLAAIMMATRKTDWYQFEVSSASPLKQATSSLPKA